MILTSTVINFALYPTWQTGGPGICLPFWLWLHGAECHSTLSVLPGRPTDRCYSIRSKVGRHDVKKEGILVSQINGAGDRPMEMLLPFIVVSQVKCYLTEI